MIHILASLLLLTASTAVRSQNVANQQSDCRAPDGESGNCVNIRKCEPLLTLLKTSSGNPEVRAFLQRSQCGNDQSGPLVCCPRAQNDATPPARPNIRDNEGIRDPDVPSYLPVPPQCGHTTVSTSRIVGGSKATLGAWPWLVVYGYKRRTTPNATPQWLCGGALVTQTHTITAAHCTQHPSLTMFVARLGELHLDPNVNDGAEIQDILVTRAIKHPQYSASKILNDIAIVVLQKPAVLSKMIQPICLPFGRELRDDSFVNKQPFVAGWGAQEFKGSTSKELRQVQLKIVANQGCAEKYRSVGGTVTERQLCASGTSLTKPADACQGDSGGPMMLPKNGSFYLVGVVSYGYRCAEPGYAGIYTRTTSYLNWLEENLQR